MVVVWMDRKPVMMLSTVAQPEVTHTVQRKQKDGSRVPVQCEDAVVLYNVQCPFTFTAERTKWPDTSGAEVAHLGKQASVK